MVGCFFLQNISEWKEIINFYLFLKNMNAFHKYQFCFLAGLCAAGGSFFGKLPSLLKENFLFKIETPYLSQTAQMYAEFLLYQCMPIVLMIVSNLLNWRYFLKALQMSEQTLTATVLTAASNYVVTFILGTFVFKEPFTLLSTFGCTVIVLGLWFLCAENQNDQEKLKRR